MQVGFDDDGDGVLSAAEVTSSQYVCNGLVGDAGVTGATGAAGGSPVVSVVAAGDAHCAWGGLKVELSGSAPAYVCNGARGDAGVDGLNGADGITPTVSALSVGSTQCPLGGVSVAIGSAAPTSVCNGAPGAAGTDGLSATVTALAVGSASCPWGGVSVQVGAGTPSSVCNGAPGDAGVAGTNGTNGDNGLSPTVTTLAVGHVSCPWGGISVQVGSAAPTFVCNGAPGDAGVDGADGASATLSTLSVGDAHCAWGGLSVQVGSGAPSYVCNGATGDSGLNGDDGLSPTVTTLSVGDAHCAWGGLSVQVGSGTPSYVCHGAPGDAGVDGAAGLSAVVTTLSVGDAHCPWGGLSVQVGAGTPSYVCSGAPGDAGVSGESPTVTTLSVGDAHCAWGGLSVQVGSGTPSYVCNGAPGDGGAPGHDALVLETVNWSAFSTCAYGGRLIQFGTDDDGDGVLDAPAEVDASTVACFAIDQDGDGAPFGSDNCPAISNPGQSDLDGDGAGDLCDATPCPALLSFCSNVCANLDTDLSHCGQCTTSCPTAPNASASCSAGACSVSCTPGFLDCNGQTGDGCEVSSNNDNNHCGSCGLVCGSGTACIQGSCSVLLRVHPTGSDSTGDGSAAAPYATIGRAITDATGRGSPTLVSIMVAGGTYAISAQLAVPARTRLAGGFSPSDWATRDIAAYPSTVDSTGYTAGSAVRLLNSSLGVDGIRVLHTGVTADYTPSFFKGCFDLTTGTDLTNSTCVIQSCGYNDSCYGILGGGGNRIEGNLVSITTGGGGNSSAYAVQLSANGAITFRGNTVFNNYTGRYAYGLKLSAGGSAATVAIENNVINAVSGMTYNGGNTVELGTLTAGSTLRFINNTVRGGFSSGGTCWAVLIAGQTGSTLRIENNIVFAQVSGSVTNGCLNIPGTFASLRNNNLFDCDNTFATVGGATQADAATLNGLTNAGANLSFDMVTGANASFVNEASDFHLQAGGAGDFLTVKGGAIDNAALFTTDRDGAPRTGSGGLGWSMGAYEKNN